MDFNLQMLNLMIGLCKGVAGLPDGIRRLGFTERAIEQNIYLDGSTQCVPELIIASELHGLTILFEWKDGPNTIADQLARYARVTCEDLRTKAFLSRQATQRMDVAVVGHAQHVARLKIGLQQGGYGFPLLLVDDAGISLGLNNFKLPALNALFSPAMLIDFASAPTSFVPIDARSELWEVADVVIPKVLEQMQDRATMIRATALCPIICPTWSIMGRYARPEVQNKICEVLQQAAADEFSATACLAGVHESLNPTRGRHGGIDDGGIVRRDFCNGWPAAGGVSS